VTGFWICIGLCVLGFAIDNGLTNIAQQLKRVAERLK
jgi:hypothetical protein